MHIHKLKNKIKEISQQLTVARREKKSITYILKGQEKKKL
jgi:hypothetical protein